MLCLLAACLSDYLSGFGRTGKAHGTNKRMFRDRRADNFSGAMNDVQDPFGKPCLDKNFYKNVRRMRRIFGRLEDERIPGNKSCLLYTSPSPRD